MVWVCVCVCVCVCARACVCVHTMENYSAKKKNEISFVTMWMDLENIIVNEIRQRKKNTVCYHLYVKSKK